MMMTKGQNLNFAIASNIIYDAMGLMRGPNDRHQPGAGVSKGVDIISLEEGERPSPTPYQLAPRLFDISPWLLRQTPGSLLSIGAPTFQVDSFLRPNQ
jgi:hypothetical protein